MQILAQSTANRARSRRPLIVASALSLLFGVVAAFGTVQGPPEPIFSTTVVESLALPPPAEQSDTGQVYIREDRFRRGDTISALLRRLNVDDLEVNRLLRSRDAKEAFRQLRPETTVNARTGEDGSLLSMWFINGRLRLISIDRSEDGFQTWEQPVDFSPQIVMKSGEIKSSLFAATDDADVSDSVAMQIADIFSGDIDFHRDLRRGDRFTAVFEMYDHLGLPVKSGRVLAAEFINKGKSYRAVWFQDESGRGGYYTPSGDSLRKAFLRSPLRFSRVTSGFKMRFHPILRRWQAHKGVDFGAPTGTPVRATGDGVVEFVGRDGGYGNVIVLRHAGGIETLYGHLSGFAKGMRKGVRVDQSELIGHVGQTGWATGPHLHYEFLVNKNQRNPLTMAFPASKPVTPQQMAAFRAATGPLAARLELLATTNLALLE